ncbi:baseplate J/gp47 family protein [Methanobrevibacter sp.]|uniref:baseplate J/gp47 family protein n=1 Tax=Methanobrevibacter sp. TaxID=66852 RepID=UPI002636B143|nr:baseplate J/gp47 family protein [uncultured Methanobrevibacter sp.]
MKEVDFPMIIDEIDDTINIQFKSFEDIFLSLLTNLYNSGALSDDSKFLEYVQSDQDLESILIIEASVLAIEISESYDSMKKVYDSKSIKTAVDEDLDELGAMFFERESAEASVVLIEFEPEGDVEFPIIVPEDFYASTDSGVSFRTVESAIINDSDSRVELKSECTEVGAIGNVLEGTIINMEEELHGIASIINQSKAYGGKDEETDENYRKRLLNWKYSLEKGTSDAITNAILTVKEVDSYYLEPYWQGPGTGRIIIDPPFDEVINNVAEVVEDVKILNEDITIEGVNYLNFTMEIVLNVLFVNELSLTDNEKELLLQKIINYILVYFNGGFNFDGSTNKGLGLGVDFIPFELAYYVRSQVEELRSLKIESLTVDNEEIHINEDNSVIIPPSMKAHLSKENINLVLS